MYDQVMFSNEFVDMMLEDGLCYLRVKRDGFSMADFNEVLLDFPRIKVTQFVALKSALISVSDKAIHFADEKPMIEISLSKDKLEAFAQVNLTSAEMDKIGKKVLMSEIISAMSSKGIIYGFDIQEIVKALQPMSRITIAKGLLPQKGDDAVTEYYKVEEAKPEIYQNGDVNHYELNLINKVLKGDWLGERFEPKDGTPGKTVTGDVIPALKGDQVAFKYDKKTVYEEYDKEKDVTYIRAARIGAVVIENDIISVCNYLEIEGKVSFKTGNVDFDGFVDIKDVVEDNFSVTADQDIQILGDMGIGGVDQIESREGSIYIRGGIAGKGKAKIVCDGDLYTKFAADCDIECNGTVHIGYYALNANIKAKEVIFDAYNSKVIGGCIEAQVRVHVGTAGNRIETPTTIKVLGFRRDKVKEEYDFIIETIDKVKEKINALKQKMTLLEMVAAAEPEKKQELNKVKEEFDFFRKNLKMLYEKQKKSISYLRAKGEGELVISQGIFPKVHVSIKDEAFWNTEKKTMPITYYTDGREILTA